MKAMIWKELKENSKWAVLAALGLGLAYAYMVRQAVGTDHYSPYPTRGLPMLTVITAPIVGLLLGLLQIIPELRRDQWAFLMHRPVPRATLFWAKVIAGLLLYLLATGLPFLGAVLWLAAPERMAAPFDWRLSLAGVADILAGTLFYFVGVLTALRPARWYGSRALGIGAAVACFSLVFWMNEFWQALLVITMCAGVLAVAARGSFLSSGEYDGQPKLAKVALGTTLFTGSAVVISGAIALIITMGSTLIPRHHAPYRWTRYKVDTKGRILRVTHEGADLKNMVDLNGKPVGIEKSANASRYGDFLQEQDLDTFGPRYWESYRTPSRYYMVLQDPYTGSGEVAWYYDRDRSLVLGYSHPDNRFIGYITPERFLPVEELKMAAPIPRFPGPLLNRDWYGSQRVLAFHDAVYRVNFSKRSIKRIISATPTQPIDGAMEFGGGYVNSEERSGIIAVAGNNQIRVYSPQHKLLVTLPWEYKPKRHHYVALSLAPKLNRLFVWYMPIVNTPSEKVYITEAVQPKGSKKPIWRRHSFYVHQPGQGYVIEVVLPKASAKPTLLRHNLPPLPEEMKRGNWQGGLVGLLIPPALEAGFMAYAAIGDAFGNNTAARIWADITRNYTSMYILLVALSLLSALLAAALALRVGRRCGFSPATQRAWAIGVLMLGPFGLLMLLSLYAWPFRETCSTCGQSRVVTNELCEHCGSRFPLPPRDGTEIFEPVS